MNIRNIWLILIFSLLRTSLPLPGICCPPQIPGHWVWPAVTFHTAGRPESLSSRGNRLLRGGPTEPAGRCHPGGTNEHRSQREKRLCGRILDLRGRLESVESPVVGMGGDGWRRWRGLRGRGFHLNDQRWKEFHDHRWPERSGDWTRNQKAGRARLGKKWVFKQPVSFCSCRRERGLLLVISPFNLLSNRSVFLEVPTRWNPGWGLRLLQ